MKPGSKQNIVGLMLPGILLAVVCLVPFLNKAYTVDDPFFLLEARQILKTPLQPWSFPMCWLGNETCLPQADIVGGLREAGLAEIPFGSRDFGGRHRVARSFASNPLGLPGAYGNDKAGIAARPQQGPGLRRWNAGRRHSAISFHGQHSDARHTRSGARTHRHRTPAGVQR